MKTILHLHIPRAGGSSVHSKMAATLGSKYCISGNTYEAIRDQIPDKGEIKYVTGHFSWGLHKYFPNSVYFIVLRNPVDRLGSLYDFIRGNTQHSKNSLYSSKSLLETLSLPEVTFTQMSNGQVRQLVGHHQVGKAMIMMHFFCALRNLFRRSVVVTFPDQIDRGLEKLARKVGCPPPSPTLVTNKSDRHHLARIERSRICRLNIWDIALYHIAYTCFGFQPKTLFGLTGISFFYSLTLKSCAMHHFLIA